MLESLSLKSDSSRSLGSNVADFDSPNQYERGDLAGVRFVPARRPAVARPTLIGRAAGGLLDPF
jgi:hypothetical protein